MIYDRIPDAGCGHVKVSHPSPCVDAGAIGIGSGVGS